MKPPSNILLALASTTLLTQSSAWTLTWSNSTNTGTVEHASTVQTCKQIYLEKGSPFSWAPDGNWCIELWKDSKCEERGGWSCDGKNWGHNVTQDIGGFDVYRLVSSTTSSSSSTKTASTASGTAVATSATATSTSTSAAAAGDASTSKSISGGAIAGIVIGVIAALTLIAALFFILGRRRRSAAAATTTPTVTESHLPPPSPGTAAETTSLSSQTNMTSDGGVIGQVPISSEKSYKHAEATSQFQPVPVGRAMAAVT